MGFNPRAREGRDVSALVNLLGTVAVSIHAPARGATYYVGCLRFTGFGFNPRAREGRD